jgi:PKD repeat protein
MTDDREHTRERLSSNAGLRSTWNRLADVRPSSRQIAALALTAVVVLGPVVGVVSPAGAVPVTDTGQAPEIAIESDADATVRQGEDATLTAYPRNNGNDDKTGIELKLLVDTDGDGTFGSDESVANTTIDLNAGESETVDLTYADVGVDPGEYATRFRAVHDGNTYDNYVDGTLTVTGGNSPPNAAFTVDRTGPVVRVTAAGSGDEDGSVESYEWSFGDGTTATGLTTTHTYEQPENYTIELTVTDDDGRTNTTERTVRLGSDEGEDNGRDLRSISYGETKTGYVDENDPHYDEFLRSDSRGRGIRYEPVSFTGEEGDIVRVTSTDRERSGGIVTTRVYRDSELVASDTGEFVLPSDGEYTIRVAFLGAARTPSELGEYTLSLHRQGGEAPAVTYEVQGDPGVDNEVTFVAQATGEDPVESYEWTFGDGTTGSGEVVTHTYEVPGSMTVTVTATDSDGDSSSYEGQVAVETEIVNRFDTDDDGLELDELRAALETVQSDDYDGGVTVRQVRKAIHERTVEDDNPSDALDDVDEDGLPDRLEERGIPVARDSLADYGDVVGETDTTERADDDPPFIVRLDTDPLDEDTDGDGLEDGEELHRVTLSPGEALARFGVFREVVYYRMLSDPTDPNSDDTGLDDGDEAKIGSDPMEPEYASVNMVVPVTGVDPTECDVSDDQIDDCAKEFYSSDLTGLPDSYSPAHVLRPADQSSGGADWLSEIETEESKTYFLVEVGLDVAFANLTDEERPKFMQFTDVTGSNADIVGQGPSKSEITPGYSPPLPAEGGTKQVFVVIETGESFGVKTIGELQARIDVPENSPVRRAGDGDVATASTDTPLVIKNNVAFTSVGEAEAMVEEASRKWAQGTISVVAPSGGAVAKLAAGGGASGAAAKLVAEGVATLSGTTDEGLLSKPGQDELIAQSIVAEGAAPGFSNRNLDTPPIANTALIWYRES